MKYIFISLFIALLSSCGGGGSSGSNTINYSASRFTVSVTVAGLSAGKEIILTDGTNNLTATTNTIYTFSTKLPNASPYQISITTQPIGQTCVIAYASGNIDSSNVTTALVNCIDNPAPTYSIGLSISGLDAGKNLTVTNGIENITATINTSYTFPTQVGSNSNYSITVLNHPNGQFCRAYNATGTVNNSNISNVSIVCSQVFTFNGTNGIYTTNISGIVSGNTARTYNGWIKIDPTTFREGVLIQQGTRSSYKRSALDLIAVNATSVIINHGSGNLLMTFEFQVGSVWSSKFDINDTNWHMITGVFDPTASGMGVSFYLDGVILPDPSPSPNGFNKLLVNTVNDNDSITIGNETYSGVTGGSNAFIGDIRNVSAWSSALTNSDVALLYSNDTRPSSNLFFTKD
jgi:hypothetical protein